MIPINDNDISKIRLKTIFLFAKRPLLVVIRTIFLFKKDLTSVFMNDNPDCTETTIIFFTLGFNARMVVSSV